MADIPYNARLDIAKEGKACQADSLIANTGRAIGQAMYGAFDANTEMKANKDCINGAINKNLKKHGIERSELTPAEDRELMQDAWAGRAREVKPGQHFNELPQSIQSQAIAACKTNGIAASIADMVSGEWVQAQISKEAYCQRDEAEKLMKPKKGR